MEQAEEEVARCTTPRKTFSSVRCQLPCLYLMYSVFLHGVWHSVCLCVCVFVICVYKHFCIKDIV